MKFLCTILIVLGTPLFCHAQNYDLSRLDGVLQDSLPQISGIGGGCALVLFKDGVKIYDKSFAVSGRTYTAATRVPIASASKWLACGVIMAMVDEKLWSLDEKAETYIKSLSGDKASMTIRQLFSMMSGINEAGGGTDDNILRNTSITLDSAVKAILALPLGAAPGTSMMYGGRGMQVAGRCAEIASGLAIPTGKCWDTLFARYVTTPLGLKQTTYDTPLNPTNNPGVAGSVISTANDYAVYLQMILNGGMHQGKRVLSEEIINEMKKDQTGGASIGYSPYTGVGFVLKDKDIMNTRYALGHWREKTDKTTGEALESSSQGAFGFSPWIDWKRNMVGVLSVWGELIKVYPTYLTIKSIIREELDRTTGVHGEPYSNVLDVIITPSPANSTLTIRFPNGTPVTPQTITITDIVGNSVWNGVVETQETTVNTNSWARGIYVVRTPRSSRVVLCSDN